MRVALAFGRPDVDAFLQDIDHDQLQEWIALFRLEPQGWEALKIVATRLSFWLVQSQTQKKLREKDFELKMAVTARSAATEKARWEAMSVRTEIEASLHA